MPNREIITEKTKKMLFFPSSFLEEKTTKKHSNHQGLNDTFFQKKYILFQIKRNKIQFLTILS